METKPLTSKEYFRTLQIIHLALIAGLLFFGLLAVFLINSGEFIVELKELKKTFFILVPVFVIGGYLGGRILFKKSMETAGKKESLPEKMADYRSALIVKYALLEGPSMLAIIAYLLTGDLSFIIIAAFIIAIFLTLRPNAGRAISDLNLNNYEIENIQDPNFTITQ